MAKITHICHIYPMHLPTTFHVNWVINKGVMATPTNLDQLCCIHSHKNYFMYLKNFFFLEKPSFFILGYPFWVVSGCSTQKDNRNFMWLERVKCHARWIQSPPFRPERSEGHARHAVAQRRHMILVHFHDFWSS